MPRFPKRWFFIAIICSVPWTSARAYVDTAPTLARLVNETKTITLVEVDRFSAEKGVVVLKKVRDLKGETGSGTLKHLLLRANESVVERSVMEWAEPGRRGVLFTGEKSVVACLGEAWYQAHPTDDGWWAIGAPRPDLPLAYYGTVARLADAIPLMVAGKSVIITTLAHATHGEGASFDLALNRPSLPGLARVQRVRVSLRAPGMTMILAGGANPSVLGMGRAGPEDIPVLRGKLQDTDPSTRADAASDLGYPSTEAREAVEDLTKLLADPVAPVRISAAAALLRIDPKAPRCLEVLTKCLTGADAPVRRDAARASGRAGPAAAPLVGKLAAALKDPDTTVRRSALEAIATLGPAAADATEAVTAMLEQPEVAADAADALGRLGPAARSASKPLVRMLSASAPAQRWAAVRALAQIGGEEAKPAAEFMMQELPKASQADSYNMMIYLALMGPVAKEAIPAVRGSSLRNPFLRQLTVWAIDPGTKLPWEDPSAGMPPAQLVLECYVQELGDHLKPVAQTLARKIMAGTAGEVPLWGYKLLARFPEESLPVLVPGLEHETLVMRERATVALGYMGPAAAQAEKQVAKALRETKDEREQRLLKWCLRQIE
jgi:HEAT repeat protein